MNKATVIIFVILLAAVIGSVLLGAGRDKSWYHAKSNPYNKKGKRNKSNVSDVWEEEQG